MARKMKCPMKVCEHARKDHVKTTKGWDCLAEGCGMKCMEKYYK